jgi:hypothetical protein
MGGWTHLDADSRWQALAVLQQLYREGSQAHEAKKELEAAERTRKRTALRADTGAPIGYAIDKDETKKKARTLKGRVKSNLLAGSSFEQVLNYGFGKDSVEARKLRREERAANFQYTDEMDAVTSAATAFLESIAGEETGITRHIPRNQELRGRRLLADLMEPDTVTIQGDKRSARSLSQLEAVQATLMWQQEDGKRHMRGWEEKRDNTGLVTKEESPWRFDQTHMDQLEAQLSPEALAFREFIRADLAQEHAIINPLYREAYGINLPSKKDYAPLTVAPLQSDLDNQLINPVTGQTGGGQSFTPGSFRTRSATAITEPIFRDAFQVYLGHKRQMAHWKAYHKFAKETSAIFGNRDTMNSVEATAGKETVVALQSWIEHFSKGGSRDAIAHYAAARQLKAWSSNAQAAALFGRISTIVVQSTQLAAAAIEMPLGAYTARLAKLTAGQLDYRAALASPYMRRRAKSMPAAIQDAMRSLELASSPGRVKQAAEALGEVIGGTDARMTAATYAILFDWYRGQDGMTEAEAHELTMDSVERVAQPTRDATRSLLEVNTTSPIARTNWAFVSEPRQKLALALWALQDKGASKSVKAKKFIIAWAAMGVASQLLKAGVRALRDDDDEPTDWGRLMLISSILGPINAVPVVGDLFDQGGLISSAPKVYGSIKRLATKDSDEPVEDAARAVDATMQLLGFLNPTAAALASLRFPTGAAARTQHSARKVRYFENGSSHSECQSRPYGTRLHILRRSQNECEREALAPRWQR